MNLFKVCIVSAMFFLSACGTLPKAQKLDSTEESWRYESKFFEAPNAQHQALNQWRYAAKIGISSPSINDVANIVWAFSDQSNDGRLFGPLGVGAVNLQFDQFGVVLSDNAGVRHRGSSAQALLTEIVGWPIPVEALSYWLHALPKPGSDYRYKLNETTVQVAAIEQLGWTIEYSAYRVYESEKSPTIMPRKIVATKIMLDNSKLVIKLITKSWKL